MKHILHHERDPVMFVVDVWLDVRIGDLDLDDSHTQVFKHAQRSKRSVAVVSRRCGGTPVFSYAPEEEAALALTMATVLLGAFGRPAPVEVTEGDSRWGKY